MGFEPARRDANESTSCSSQVPSGPEIRLVGDPGLGERALLVRGFLLPLGRIALRRFLFLNAFGFHRRQFCHGVETLSVSSSATRPRYAIRMSRNKLSASSHCARTVALSSIPSAVTVMTALG